MNEETEAALMSAGHQIAALMAQRDALRIELDQLRTYAGALNQRCIKDTPDAERWRTLDAMTDEQIKGIYWPRRYGTPQEFIRAVIDAARSKT